MPRLARLILAATALQAQRVEFGDAEPLRLPGVADSNSPSFWRDGRFHIYTSNGTPSISAGDSQNGPFQTTEVALDRDDHLPMWIESVWQEGDGAVFAWYHHERVGVCPGLTVPRIGALVSTDGGMSFRDLGVVLESGEPANCDARNGFFAGGHGDFSVAAARDGYFYFFFGVYDGPAGAQGVSVARMAMGDRWNPVGAAWKYFDGSWSEPGLGGRVSPVFPARAGWEQPDTDSFWGPSVHWNTHLEAFVMLLNRSCCAPGWPQEAIYISANRDVSDPSGWSEPAQLIGAGSWYPQVIGTGPGETDSVAGRTARLYVFGESNLEIEFLTGSEPASVSDSSKRAIRVWFRPESRTPRVDRPR